MNMFRKMTVTGLALVVQVLVCTAADAQEGGCAEQSYSIDVFGGEFKVPHYMSLVVNTRSDRSEEARLVRKIDEEGSIILMRILRNDEKGRPVGKTSRLVDSYELNGFTVQIYQSSDPDISRNLYSALIERSGDKAQVIVDSLKALDALLANAEDLEAEVLD